MRNLGTRLNSSPEAAGADFYVILAAQQLWTEYRVQEIAGEQAYGVQVHASVPQDDTPVVVTSYDVIVGLLNGSLTIEETLDAGLLQIRGADSGHVIALFRGVFSVKQGAS